jgi:ATP-binding cassette subfamily C (CFTR/MRP) protein 1
METERSLIQPNVNAMGLDENDGLTPPSQGPLFTKVSLLSRLFFLYMNKVIDFGRKQTFEVDDLWSLPEEIQFKNYYPAFEEFYNAKRKENPEKNKLGWIIFLYTKWRAIAVLCTFTVSSLMDVTIPLFIKQLIAWLANPEAPWWHGLVWASVISVVYAIKLTISRRGYVLVSYHMHVAGMVVRGLIFNKLSRLSREAISNLNLGNLTNIINHDTFKLQLMIRLQGFVSILTVLSTVGFIYFIYFFNWLAIIFPAMFLIWLGIVFTCNHFLYLFQKTMIGYADKRAKLISECLSGIKNIKFECWEDISQDRIQHYRRLESKNLFFYFFIRNIMNSLMEMFTPLFLLVFLSLYTINYGEITIDKAYLLISLCNMVQQPLKASVTLLDAYASVKVALARLNEFLEIPEIVQPTIDTSLPVGRVELSNLSTGWRSAELSKYFKQKDNIDAVTLRNISFNFAEGNMYAIVGKVGSGKSAFLMSVLGELSIKTGTIRRNGTLAYVPQTPFLLNASVRENITFGLPYNSRRYRECLVKCRLVDDIKVLPGGDSTEIGERGVNLSGGQKQRISLARALYANRDIYLIDDTLSALDSQVAHSVFNDVIVQEFKNKGKTVLLVTHALAVVGFCDEVLLLDKGEITLSGPFESIKNHEKYVEYSTNQKEEEKGGYEAQPDPAASKKVDNQAESGKKKVNYDEEDELKQVEVMLREKEEQDRQAKLGKLTKKEEKQAGRVACSVYWKYIKSFGVFYFFGSVLLFAYYIFARNISDYWIGIWCQKAWKGIQEPYQYRLVYIIMIAIMFVVVIVRSYLLSKGMGNVGVYLNGKMMETVFKRPISFFESTPIGIIINRCTKDMLDLDLVFNNFFQHLMANSAQFVSMVVVLSITVPFMIVIFVIVIFMCIRYIRIITLVASDIKRIQLVAASPMISNVSEIFGGVLTVKSYDKVVLLRRKFYFHHQQMLNAEMHGFLVEGWTFSRIEYTSSLIVIATTFFSFMIKVIPITTFNSVTSLSLAISWSAISGDFLGFLLMTFSEVMKGMSSVERMLEIAESTDLEPDHLSPAKPPGWPNSAQINIHNLNMRYRPNLPLVLKSIDLQIGDQEKVGVVGRTGSGKSSLILALMRIIEKDKSCGEGFIKIDGVSTDSVGLRYAREAITLIPQDAFVLSVTIRSNVDPHNNYRDADVIQVLQKTKLLESLSENFSRLARKHAGEKKGAAEEGDHEPLKKETPSDEKLLTLEVESGGSNLSQGQRQLLCIARAMIKKPKVLLMDEATASIDTKTDEIIQGLIKSDFKESTILTIAHRLNTIIQYDKILSLRDGVKVEYGRPIDLLQDGNSYFCQLVKENGEEFYQEMKKLATERERNQLTTNN